MLRFSEYLTEDLISVNGKGKRFPQFGNVVIMAGGAGSGKGHILDKLLGIEGHTYNVDDLKKLSPRSPLLRKKAKEKLGVDLKKYDTTIPGQEDVLKDDEKTGE